MKTIRFKSIPMYWEKEYSGLKRNTLREFDDKDDAREDVLVDYLCGRCNIINVVIENTHTHEIFERLVTDVTQWNDIYIISW